VSLPRETCPATNPTPTRSTAAPAPSATIKGRRNSGLAALAGSPAEPAGIAAIIGASTTEAPPPGIPLAEASPEAGSAGSGVCTAPAGTAQPGTGKGCCAGVGGKSGPDSPGGGDIAAVTPPPGAEEAWTSPRAGLGRRRPRYGVAGCRGRGGVHRRSHRWRDQRWFRHRCLSREWCRLEIRSPLHHRHRRALCRVTGIRSTRGGRVRWRWPMSRGPAVQHLRTAIEDTGSRLALVHGSSVGVSAPGGLLRPWDSTVSRQCHHLTIHREIQYLLIRYHKCTYCFS
jgi:hypothetical protein